MYKFDRYILGERSFIELIELYKFHVKLIRWILGRRTESVGQKGEWIAQKYLENKGYSFILRNWRNKLGEIDLVMKEGNTLVFVEVKTISHETSDRGVASEFDPLDHMDQRKIRLFRRIVEIYMDQNRYQGDFRLDVVGIRLSADQSWFHVEHIENAA